MLAGRNDGRGKSELARAPASRSRRYVRISPAMGAAVLHLWEAILGGFAEREHVLAGV